MIGFKVVGLELGMWIRDSFLEMGKAIEVDGYGIRGVKQRGQLLERGYCRLSFCRARKLPL